MTFHTKPQRFRNHCVGGGRGGGGWEFRYLVLFYYGLFNKIYDKIKYLMSELVVLRIVLIIFLEKSESINIIVYLLK